MISHFSIPWVVKLFGGVALLFCCLVFSFQYISKLCYGRPWKCFIQPLYLFFYVFYKLFHTVLASVHFEGVRDISIGKGAVYTPSWRYMCIYLFRIWCLAFLSVFIVFILSLYRSLTGFKILSKSAYSINETLNWYCLSWNFNHFFFLQWAS